jgi:AraC-like DNA-binding protein
MLLTLVIPRLINLKLTMKCRVILGNNNQVLSEKTCEAHHQHLCGTYTINVVLRGKAEYRVGNRLFNLTAGNLLFINSKSSYSYKIDSIEAVHILSLSFEEDFVVRFHEMMGGKHTALLEGRSNFGEDTRPVFLESIHLMQGEMQKSLFRLNAHIKTCDYNHNLIEEHVEECLLAYYKLYRREITDRAGYLQFSNVSTRTEILKRLMIAKDYILSNYNLQISLQNIADVACLSVNHLLRTFKQAFQLSPHQFVTEARLQQAKYLLTNTDYPVKEITSIIGFDCPSSFVRLFRTRYSFTPGCFREEYHSDKMEIFAH